MRKDTLLLTVQSVRRPTPSSIELRFAPSQERLQYKAGQYLTFHVPIEGRLFSRAYSLVGSPGRGDQLSIIVKRVQGGVVSSHLHAYALPGLTLAASVPQGRFFVEPRASGRHAVLVGGGSGITPLHSIAHELLHGEPQTTVSLVYCNVDPEEIILRAELESLAEEYRSRFRIVQILERDAARMGGLAGRLDVSRGITLLGELSRERLTEFYLCGPEGLMGVARAALRALAVPPDLIHQEHFTRPEEGGSGEGGREEAQLVVLRVGGREYPITVPPGAMLLDAALTAGAPLESSCRVGDCGTCKLRLLHGEVRQSRNEGLTPEEEQLGYVLSCVSSPRSAGVILEAP